MSANSGKNRFEQLAFDLPRRVVPNTPDSTREAGFFDGEGCVNLTSGRGELVKAQVMIVNTDLGVLEWYRERWGGAIYKHKPGTARQPAFQWQLGDLRRMTAFLEDLRPHMRVKMPQTDNCLAFLRLKAQRRPRAHFTEAERADYAGFLKAHRALDLTHGGQAPHTKAVA